MRQKRTRSTGYIGECWLWPLTRTKKGYGHVSVQGKKRIAHKFIFEVFHGEVAEGLVLDHLCNIPACVNPFHLVPTTNRANVMRGNGPTAINNRKTICIKGHPLYGKNLYIYPDGRRSCRVCRKELSASWNQRQKQSKSLQH